MRGDGRPVSPEVRRVISTVSVSSHRQLAKEVGHCAYAGYYTLTFFAYFFGAARYFDCDGDGDFDAADMQLMIDRGLWKSLRQFFQTPNRRDKVAMNKLKQRKLTKSESGALPGAPPRPNERRSLQDGSESPDATFMATIGHATNALDDMQEMASAPVEGLAEEDIVEARLRQYWPWFSILQVVAMLLLWMIFAAQGHEYTAVSQFCRQEVDGSKNASNLMQWTGGEKSLIECQMECDARAECAAIAFARTVPARCALLSSYTSSANSVEDCFSPFPKPYDGWWFLEQAKKDSAFWGVRAGLDSLFPGETILQAKNDCEGGFSWQMYRLLSHQFTHGGFGHVGSNSLMILVMGISLEGANGSIFLWGMFNIGVFGGGLSWLLWDPHRTTYGASGGCYALLGMHLADLTLNWGQKKFRYMELGLLLIVTLVEVLANLEGHTGGVSASKPSHTVHYGGAIAGLIIGCVAGQNFVVHKWELRLKWVMFCLGFILTGASLGFWFTNPFPGIRDLWYFGHPAYCWQGKIWLDEQLGGVGWKCLQCDTRQCVEEWYKIERLSKLAPASYSSCNTLGYYNFTYAEVCQRLVATADVDSSLCL